MNFRERMEILCTIRPQLDRTLCMHQGVAESAITAGCQPSQVVMSRLDEVDRVVGMCKGQIAFDGPPGNFRWELLAPTADAKLHREAQATSKDSAGKASFQQANAASPAPALSNQRKQRLRPGMAAATTWIRQTGLLVAREVIRLLNSPVALIPLPWGGRWSCRVPQAIKRLGVAEGLLPPVFAFSIALAVPISDAASERALLAFLSVLACVWLGTSLSLTSIVDEIHIIDHERLLFLHWPCYVCAK